MVTETYFEAFTPCDNYDRMNSRENITIFAHFLFAAPLMEAGRYGNKSTMFYTTDVAAKSGPKTVLQTLKLFGFGRR